MRPAMEKRRLIGMFFKSVTACLFLIALCCAIPATAMEIDFSKAVVVGSGPKKVVEFTDPDCPFCRNASKFFARRADVTCYIFFNPLPNHHRAKEKVQYILSQADKARAYQEAMAGKFDNVPKLTGITEKGIRLQEEQAEIVRSFKANSTPTFIINGRIIVGLDVKKIEEALGAN